MNLVSKSSFLFHSKNVMRLGVMLVICSLLVNMVAVPKAKAVALVDDVAVGAAATAAYLTSTGIPLTVTAGGASAASAGIVAVAGEYAAATGAAASGEAVLSSIAAGTALTAAGTVVLTAAAAVAVGALAYWVYQTYFLDSSTSVIYNDSGYFDVSGSPLQFSTRQSSSPYYYVGGTVHNLSDSYSINGKSVYYDSSLNVLHLGNVTVSGVNSPGYCFGYESNGSFCCYFGSIKYNIDGTILGIQNFQTSSWASVVDVFGDPYVNASLSGDGLNYSPIPEIEPAKQLELDIAAPPELGLADLPEYTMNKVAAGDWSQPSNVPYSVTSVDPDSLPDPDPDPAPSDPSGSDPTVPDDTPDIDDLGLPDLGAALTTRFPFSIPWDIYRGLKLLSAPAEVPKFEVDIFAPLNNRVGGWKGDTKIVIDFGYYPEFSFIGELCRWTSTIGYCLFLASATKRFIWTA